MCWPEFFTYFNLLCQGFIYFWTVLNTFAWYKHVQSLKRYSHANFCTFFITFKTSVFLNFLFFLLFFISLSIKFFHICITFGMLLKLESSFRCLYMFPFFANLFKVWHIFSFRTFSYIMLFFLVLLQPSYAKPTHLQNHPLANPSPYINRSLSKQL